MRPARIAGERRLVAATIGSQPITRSASAVPTLVVWIASGRFAIWMWLQVAPPFCARPAGVLRDDALALEVRGHAEQLADRDDAGAADAGDDDAPRPLGHRQRRLRDRRQRERGRPRGAFFALFSWPPSTVTKLGQKPFTQE